MTMLHADREFIEAYRTAEIPDGIYATGATGAATGATPRSTASLLKSPLVPFDKQSREMCPASPHW